MKKDEWCLCPEKHEIKHAIFEQQSCAWTVCKPRITIVGGLLLIAICMLGISRCNSFEEVVFLYAVIGAGSGFALIPAVVLVSHWFRSAHRGLATGLMFMGIGAATIFVGLYIPSLDGGQSMSAWRSGGDYW